MLDLRPILSVVGILLLVLAASMAVPALLDLALGHRDWTVFAISGAVTGFVGGALFLSTRGVGWPHISVRQTFLMTTLSWVALTAFASLPFVFSELEMSLTDAFFEAMSGITTTGSTVISGLDHAPPGILLWRALLQWLGGVGIIIMAIALLPILRVGGMQLFRTESSDTSEKALPRAAQLAGMIAVIYVLLTAVWAVMMMAAGLAVFDAVAHAMTTIATGGYSTRDGSVGAFDNVSLDYIVTAGMIMGGMPFVLYLKAVRGNLMPLLTDSQVRTFLALLGVVILLMVAHNVLGVGMELADAVRYAAFNVVSVMTGTGYATTDYGAWGSLAVVTFLFLKFIGGCAGSTTCGIKIFRFQVLYSVARTELRRMLRPRAVFVAHYNRRPIGGDVAESVLGFFFLFVMCFAVLAGLLGLMGLDFVTSVSGAATAIANVGPGLGDIIGPAGNFAPLPDQVKWLLCAGMLVGRLELFTVLVLFLPGFWRE